MRTLGSFNYPAAGLLLSLLFSPAFSEERLVPDNRPDQIIRLTIEVEKPTCLVGVDQSPAGAAGWTLQECEDTAKKAASVELEAVEKSPLRVAVAKNQLAKVQYK